MMLTTYINRIKQHPKQYFLDCLLIIIMAVLAACGLIYQYLLANYTGRILGIMEHAIFTMIGTMIVAMGIGALLAKFVRCPYSGFAWLEISIALLGACGILLIGGAFALSQQLPQILAINYNLPFDLHPQGGFFYDLQQVASITPYIIGGIIGILIGMEIPFIARVREQVYQQHLEHNAGTIYGADYLGAGVGAALFVVYMLAIPPERAALFTASANLIAGLAFFFVFYRKIANAALLFILHLGFIILLAILFKYATNWAQTLENILYQDPVVFSHHTEFQHITLTKRNYKTKPNPVYRLYLNGRTQFSSDDEYIYHNLLVNPAMLIAKKHHNVLIIGGGDGLALRDVLAWQPMQVTVLELDQAMVELFSKPLATTPPLNEPLLKLNQYAFQDPRTEIIFGDAFNTTQQLIKARQQFDVIIVDLPDPSHPNLNKLYALQFYQKLLRLLHQDGAIAIQSTSPYHAKKAFLTVGVTMKAAGFPCITHYQHNIPSFGQWGWTLATNTMLENCNLKTQIKASAKKIPPRHWANQEVILASFAFGNGFFDIESELEPNRLGSNLMYLLHQKSWQDSL